MIDYTIRQPYFVDIRDQLDIYQAPIPRKDKELFGDDSSEMNLLFNEIKEVVLTMIEIKKGSTCPPLTSLIEIKNKQTDQVIFSKLVEHPRSWDDIAVRVFTSKYLLTDEVSIYNAVARVVSWLCFCGMRGGYFNKEGQTYYNYISYKVFADRLIDVILLQRGTFNSPVWFNVGNTFGDKTPYDYFNTSACYITKVEDNMGSIMGQSLIQQMIALFGSGSGCDITTIRSKKEWIGKQKGRPSGPVGFLEAFSALLHVTKSGGLFRRAAGLTTMKVYHPDILDYIRLKANEERKGRVLSENIPEWDNNFSGEGPYSIFGSLKIQDINTAVRLTQEFWDAYDKKENYNLYDRHGKVIDTLSAVNVLNEIAKAQLECGDPGLQFDDNINVWNPFLESGKRYNASNPCGEFNYLDNSACNLASLRLTAYYNKYINTFDTDLFISDIRTMILAQDILIDFSVYSTKEIAKTSYTTRPLGLNFGDLGNLLFQMNVPYDSDEGRYVATMLSSGLTFAAIEASNRLGKVVGCFDEYANDISVREGWNRVFAQHVSADRHIKEININDEILNLKIYTVNNSIVDMRVKNILGVLCSQIQHISAKLTEELTKKECLTPRNAVVTLMAPMGTVGFTLGCKTTGIEPFLSHAYTKDLVGGSRMEFITEGFEENNKIYETALGTNGKSILSPESHIYMMAAIQPFISGASSKTVNLSSDVTVEKIISLYELSYKLGIKAMTLYVDGSKVLQPLKTKGQSGLNLPDPNGVFPLRVCVQLADQKFYVFFGWHPSHLQDVWEVWLRMPGVGGTLDGTMSTIAIMISQQLQYGIKHNLVGETREAILKTLLKMTFPPNGFVVFPDAEDYILDLFGDIHQGKSIPNLIGQMLSRLTEYPFEIKYKKQTDMVDKFLREECADLVEKPQLITVQQGEFDNRYCPACGRTMIKSGMSSTCYECRYCGDKVGSCG